MLSLDRYNNAFAAPGWRDMLQMHDAMDRLMSRISPRTNGFPTLNLWTNEQGAVVTTELPGVELNDLNITVAGNTLTLRGTRNPLQLNNGETFQRRERGHGRFGRVVQLPFSVEANEVSATMRDGVLTITLPKAQSERPRKIEIQTAQ